MNEIKEKGNKKNIAKIIVLVISLIVIGISGTYAYYTRALIGNPTETKATAGVFKIISSLENTLAINNTRLTLINAADKEIKAEKVTFTVTSLPETTVKARYYISLKDIELSKNLYTSYLKWELVRDTGDVIASGNFANAIRNGAPVDNEAANTITKVEDIALTTAVLTSNTEDGLVLEPDSTDTLTFRMWLENDPAVNQISLTNGSFKGRLYLDAVPISEIDHN